MVNAKGVAFKVNKQIPISQAPPHAYGTVINCRKPAGKRAVKESNEARSHYVSFSNVEGSSKRKWGEEKDHGALGAGLFMVYQNLDAASSSTTPEPPGQVQKRQKLRPPRAKKFKLPSIGVDLDCWFIILSFAEPGQLLLMRLKIPSCFQFLSKNPTLWKHSRTYHYGDLLPDPPSELTEFQYADLRHDHGCMSCKAPSTRKTYWAFLRRWCKTCLNSKTEKEHDALVALREAHGDECMMLQKCLPSGIFDSWGNFVGVGPATTHALKTVFLITDVKALVAEYSSVKAKNTDPTAWPAEFAAWYQAKTKLVEERKAFARSMEAWEESMRNDRTCDYSAKKAARKLFFQQKASELSPAIKLREMECCPSYKRAIAIPKEPNNTSWLQLKPKLEKEAAELRSKGGPPEDRLAAASASGTSTPNRIAEPQNPYRFTTGFPQGLQYRPQPPRPSHNHTFLTLPPLPSHSYQNLSPPPPSLAAHQLAAYMIRPPPPPPPAGSHLTGPPPPHSHMF